MLSAFAGGAWDDGTPPDDTIRRHVKIKVFILRADYYTSGFASLVLGLDLREKCRFLNKSIFDHITALAARHHPTSRRYAVGHFNGTLAKSQRGAKWNNAVGREKPSVAFLRDAKTSSSDKTTALAASALMSLVAAIVCNT